MTRARDVAFIRKLCGLGLAPQALAQALLPALRGIVRAHSAGVFWVDERGEISALFAERMLPPEALATYHERHYKAGAARFAEAFARRSRSRDPVSYASFSPAEQEGAYFRDVMQPLDAYHVMYAVLFDGARAAAQLSLYRGRDDPPFGAGDAATLRPLVRYLAAGLLRPLSAASDREPASSAVTVEEALGIVDGEGRWVSAPERWVRLLRLAALSSVSPREAAGERDRLLAFARGACRGLPASGADVAELRVETASGRFAVRVFRLPDPAGRRDDQFGLLLRREEPRALSLVRGTGRSALSPQQREVALRLAQGLTNPEIASALGLSANTASYHVKQVYARLGVCDRHEVAARLLELAQAGSAR
jgi:DNA-binding CsgD family transcriptional regulator